MNLNEAREFFKKDVFATEVTGAVIEEVGENYAKCSLKIEDKHKNAANQVMGGAIFTLADFTFAVATNNMGNLTVTAVSQISYLGPAKGDTLIAEAKLIKDGKRNCFFEILIKDNRGYDVAIVSSNGVHLEN